MRCSHESAPSVPHIRPTGYCLSVIDKKPQCPLQMHFGEKDEGIPLDVVEAIKKKQPQAETYVYPGAPHGFYCDERASYRKDAGDLAWSRTQEFLTKHMK